MTQRVSAQVTQPLRRAHQTWRNAPHTATLGHMSKRGRSSTQGERGAAAERSETLTLAQAAELIGMNPADLAGFIREAGLEPAGPEAEWRLEADDVMKLKAERAKTAQRNLAELAKAAEALP